MKFNVGDKVFIRKHTKEEKEMYPFGWMPWRMNEIESHIGTILSRSLSDGKPCYHVLYGDYEAYFTESSLALVDYEQF